MPADGTGDINIAGPRHGLPSLTVSLPPQAGVLVSSVADDGTVVYSGSVNADMAVQDSVTGQCEFSR